MNIDINGGGKNCFSAKFYRWNYCFTLFAMIHLLVLFSFYMIEHSGIAWMFSVRSLQFCSIIFFQVNLVHFGRLYEMHVQHRPCTVHTYPHTYIHKIDWKSLSIIINQILRYVYQNNKTNIKIKLIKNNMKKANI